MNWLLLRGLTREARHWHVFPKVLEEATGGRVVALDLPGVGTEAKRRSPITVRGVVDDLRRRWLPLRDGQRWGLMGVSLGGMITLQWGAAHREDFERLVVINSSAGNLSLPIERLRAQNFPSLLRVSIETSTLSREQTILSLTTRMVQTQPIAEQWAGFATETPIGRGVTAAQLLAGVSFRAPLAIEVPLMVVASARDSFTDPSCSTKLAARYRAKLAIHPEAGHDLSLDNPSWLADEVKRWTG